MELNGSPGDIYPENGLFNSDRRTFQAIGEKDEILAKLDEVAAELEEDMERTGWTGKTVTLKYKLDTYQGMEVFSYITMNRANDLFVVFTRAKSFDRWISTKKEDLFAVRLNRMCSFKP